MGEARGKCQKRIEQVIFHLPEMWEISFMLGIWVFAGALYGFKTPPEYYRFACPRTDQLTNLAFLAVGIYRLFTALKPPPFHHHRSDTLWDLLSTHFDMEKFIFAWLCIATAVGSQLFHKNPTPRTLFYDRLPMVADMVYMLIVYAHMPLCVAAAIPAFAISYAVMEDNSYPYVVFQGATMVILMIPSCGLVCPSILYASAKLCEYYDHGIYRRLGFSGHSLKHLLAAAAMWLV
jgi:hypothetical protein